MPDVLSIRLDRADILQILDGIENRAEAWERTAKILRGNEDTDAFFIAEECSNPNEADQIAKHYRDIADKLESQLSAIAQLD